MVMLSTRYCRDTLVQFFRRIAVMSEDRNMCNCEYRVHRGFFNWVKCGDDYESELWNHCRIQTTALGGEWTGEDDDVKSFSLLTNRNTKVWRSAGAADSEIELRAID